METLDPQVSSLISIVRLTPLSSAVRVEWIESKDEIRARRADKQLATQIPISVYRILQAVIVALYHGEPDDYVPLRLLTEHTIVLARASGTSLDMSRDGFNSVEAVLQM